MSDLSPVAFVAIESPCGRFQLSDLFRDDGSFYQTPSLQLRKHCQEGGEELECWDNDYYILELFRAIETDTHTSEYFELLETCGKYHWEMDEVLEILNEIFQMAKYLKIFNG